MSPKTVSRAVIGAALIIPFFDRALHAAFTTFTNEATFLATVGEVNKETFNGVTTGDFTVRAFQYFQIDATNANDADILSGGSFGNIDGTTFFSGFVSTPSPTADTINFNIVGQSHFFGATIHSPGSTAGVKVLADGQLVQSLTSFGDNTTFFGFRTDNPLGFQQVTFMRSGDNALFGEIFDMDNIYTEFVPEPSSALLIAPLLLGLHRRRRGVARDRR